MKNPIVFVIKNGVLKKYKGTDAVVTVPDGVTSIGDSAFWGCESLKSVALPEGLTSIGNEAFYWCSNLTGITLPESLTSIGDWAFSGCAALKEIFVPDGVQSLGEGAFSGCSSLTKIHLPTSAAALPPELLKDCAALSSVVIPGAVREIGTDLFSGCSALTDIRVEETSQCFSAADGFLYNKSGDALLYVAGGLDLQAYTVPPEIRSIGPRAFADCAGLQKIVIPATVENVGDEAFPRGDWNHTSPLTDIEVSPDAGKGAVGANVFDFGWNDDPLVYPKLPVTFVKEPSTRALLALGYCLNPERYEGEYAELYRKYAASHRKSITKKVRNTDLLKLEAYYDPEGSKQGGYRPDLGWKKPNDLRKVLLLEEAVMNGTPADVEAVMKTYAPFELTARALGLAARYRGIDYVRVLAEHGASFRFETDSSMIGKYSVCQTTVSGAYRTEYYLMIVPDTLDLSNAWTYDYSPLCGAARNDIPLQTEENVLPLSERIEIAKFFAANPALGVSLDEMLMCALLQGGDPFCRRAHRHGRRSGEDAAVFL